MDERALRIVVIGGAGRVGRGLVDAFRDRGHAVKVVDPAVEAVPGESWARPATAELAGELGPADLAVLSLPSRGNASADVAGRPSAVAAATLPGRLAALELALAVLAPDGRLVELAGSEAVAPGRDAGGWLARWQRAVHRGLGASMAGRAHLCAVEVFIGPPERGAPLSPEGLAAALIELGRGGGAPAFVRLGGDGIGALAPEPS